MVNEINLDPHTEVKIKDIDVEVVKGDLKEKPWLIESEGENYVLLEEEQYDKIITLLKKTLEDNLELKMEQRIMYELPFDVEDVKTVVKQEMVDNNIQVGDAIKTVKVKYPNLFHKIDVESIFSEFLQ